MKKINTLRKLCLCAFGCICATNVMAEDITVTYTYKMGTQTLGTRQVTETVGNAPTEQANIPVYVTATGFPETIVAGTDAYEITTEYNSQMPFEVSTDGTPVYYSIRFDFTNPNNSNHDVYCWKNDNNDGKGDFWGENITTSNFDIYRWYIVGDWFNGFVIKDKEGRFLTASSTTATGTTSLQTTGDATKTHFLLEKYNGNRFWRFKLKDASTNIWLAHTSSGAKPISSYAGANDYNGYATIFHKVGTDMQAVLDELQGNCKADAEAWLAKTGVGLPTATATQRTQLANKVTELSTYTIGNFSYKQYLDFIKVYTGFFVCADVQLPEEGKAYRLINSNPLYPDYGEKILAIAGGKVSLVDAVSEENADVWVVRKNGDKFVLVNGRTGGYMELRGSGHSGQSNGKGNTAAYVADWSDAIIKPVKGNHVGYVQLSFKRDASARASIIRDKSGENEGFSIASEDFISTERYNQGFKMIEVAYPTTAKVNTVTNINNIKGICTYSAPYPVVVPENYTAWYVSESITPDNKVNLVEVTGAVPANEGVLISGPAAEAIALQPVTTETIATITGNKLGNTAGAAKDLAEGDYILTSGAQGVAFYPIDTNSASVAMNKAYLRATGSGAPSLVLSFGDETDAIQAIESVKGQNAPIYDMQGRRVQKAVKGLYIQGGKKFMVK